VTATAEFVFSEGIDDDANARLHAVAQAVLAEAGPAVLDVVPSYRVLQVEYDGAQTTRHAIAAMVRRAARSAASGPAPRTVAVPTAYDGPDLAHVASATGLTPAEVVRIHAERTYRVYALGFTPGYPFMGTLDERIRVPRRHVPRARVEAHSVAIANGQAGIYPLASPGGWHVIGTALVAMYDPHRTPPFLLEPGHRVRFVPSDGRRPPEPTPLELLPAAPRIPALEVERPGLLDLVVDRGRLRSGRYGLARSGPLDPLSARRANDMLANPASAPLLEINIAGPSLRIVRNTLIGVAGFGVKALLDGKPVPDDRAFAAVRGQAITFRPLAHGVRAYLALPGGIESRHHRGSASVDVRGLIGRPLEAGDVLGQLRSVTVQRVATSPQRHRLEQPAVIRLRPGPQHTPEAAEALLGATFTVDQADRMGVRLGGAHVPGGEVVSEPTGLGAVQVTAGGHPLILLNDRGTLGGYDKPAIVDARDLWRVGQLRADDLVRFTMPGPPNAAAGGAARSTVHP
jgi:KipI family sensor histidine kinase inhibitor